VTGCGGVGDGSDIFMTRFLKSPGKRRWKIYQFEEHIIDASC